MRNLIAVPAMFAAMLTIGSMTPSNAGVSVSFSVGMPVGYSTCEDDPEMDNSSLIMLGDGRIGYWTMLPDGRWVMRCRSMWFNRGYEAWCYGPWMIDYSVGYDPYWSVHFVNFYDFIHVNYPRYYDRNFRNDRWWYRGNDERYNHPRGWMRDNDRGDRWQPQDNRSNRTLGKAQVYKSEQPTVSRPQVNRNDQGARATDRPNVSRPQVNRNDQVARNDHPARTDGGMRRR
jgi:hypothetical protein